METRFWLIVGAVTLIALAVIYHFRPKRESVSVGTRKPSNQLQPTLEMKQLNGRPVPFQNDLPYSMGETQSRPRLSLNGAWKKMRSPGNHTLSLAVRDANNIALLQRENPEAVSPAFDDHAWQSYKVPGVENPPPDRYMDVTWYRRNFTPPASFSGKRTILTFGAANYVADVWINGQWVGVHEGGSTPFSFDITSKLKSDEDNLVTVRVDNIPWLPQKIDAGKAEPANGSDIVPYKTGDWWNFGGLLRDVEIEAVDPIAIFRAEVRPKYKGGNTDLDVVLVIGNTTGVKSPVDVRFKIYPARITPDNLTSRNSRDIADLEHGIEPEISSKTSFDLSEEPFDARAFALSSPLLEPWELRNPKLYVLEAQLTQDGKILDTFCTQFGVRTVDANHSHIKINGRPAFLRGIAAHETFPGSDPAIPPTVEEMLRRDFEHIYDLNVNFLRTGHWPAHPLTLLMADRLGIGVWEEIPVYWFGDEEFEYQRTTRPVARQMFLEMIARDLNRPSILVWGTCNECGGQEKRSAFIRDLRDHSRKYDDSRLVAQSAAGNDAFDKTQKECDIAGFTSYFGVFYGYNYGPATEKALEAMRAAKFGKAMIATEFGIWSERDLSNSDTQVQVVRETYEAFAKKSFVTGSIWWALNDWHTMITDPQSMGLVTFDGRRKPAYYALQELYAAREGRTFLKWYSPLKEKPIRGQVDVELEMVSPAAFKSLAVELDGKPLPVEKVGADGRFKFKFDSSKFPEGDHVLSARAENQVGTVLSQNRTLFIDNVDEKPAMTMNLQSGDTVMENQRLQIAATDDRGIQRLQVSVDDQPAETVEPLYPPSIYVRQLNFDAGIPSNAHKVRVKMTDTGGQTTESVLSLTLAGKDHGIYVDLPLNQDWVSTRNKLEDGTGWDFPAEELPLPGKPFVFNSRNGPVAFRFPNTTSGARNCVECKGQTINLPKHPFKAIHILAAMHDGVSPTAFQLNYPGGLPRTVMLGFSDWWRGDPTFGEEVAIKTAFHHEKSGDWQKKPGVGIYMQTIQLPEGSPVSLTLPNDNRVRIFAITLEK